VASFGGRCICALLVVPFWEKQWCAWLGAMFQNFDACFGLLAEWYVNKCLCHSGSLVCILERCQAQLKKNEPGTITSCCVMLVLEGAQWLSFLLSREIGIFIDKNSLTNMHLVSHGCSKCRVYTSGPLFF
jgi:hypothetical protein